MEKGPSRYTKYWTSALNEVKHFYKHGKKMGYRSIEDYSRAAVKFYKNNDRGIRSFVTRDNSIYKYNPKTNEFAIVSEEGKLVTYYKPTNGEYYFESRFYEDFGEYWLS